jgi:hypothetical protein
LKFLEKKFGLSDGDRLTVKPFTYGIIIEIEDRFGRVLTIPITYKNANREIDSDYKDLI